MNRTGENEEEEDIDALLYVLYLFIAMDFFEDPSSIDRGKNE